MKDYSCFIEEFHRHHPEVVVQTDHLLAPYTYIKIGGPADLFLTASSEDCLKTAYSLAIKHHIKVFILGGGSNLIFSDNGFQGLVVQNQTRNIQQISPHRIVAQSGVLTNTLVHYSLDHNLTGLEYFLGIPGTVGGAIYNNSHYQNKLIGDLVTSVSALLPDSQVKVFTPKELKFAYDYSIFQAHPALILSATFQLAPGDGVSLKKQARLYTKHRASTQPLSTPNSGCIFKNPPSFSAGKLIEEANLKGFQIGGAQVSTKHANFIINTGNATASDVSQLINQIQLQVYNKFQIKLEPEVFFITHKNKTS